MKKRRFIGLLLAAAMLLALLPSTAMAMNKINGSYRYSPLELNSHRDHKYVLLSGDEGKTFFNDLSSKGNFGRDGIYYTASVGNVGGLSWVNRNGEAGFAIQLPDGSYIKRTGSSFSAGITTTTNKNSATLFKIEAKRSSGSVKYAIFEWGEFGDYHLVINNGKPDIEYKLSVGDKKEFIFTLFSGDISADVGIKHLSAKFPVDGTDGSGIFNETIILVNHINETAGPGKYQQAQPFMNFDIPTYLATAPGTNVQLNVELNDPYATYEVRPSDGNHNPRQMINGRIGYLSDWSYWHGNGKYEGNCLKAEIVVTAQNGDSVSYFVYGAPAPANGNDLRYVVYNSNYPAGSGMSNVTELDEYKRNTREVYIKSSNALFASMPAPTGMIFACWNTKKDGTGTRYNGNTDASVNLERNLVLYAVWCGEGLHQWAAPTYDWDEDLTSCLAEAVCSRCGEELWQLGAISTVVTPAGCDTAEVTSCTAVFTNGAFTTQTKSAQTKFALGHDYQFKNYEWSADFTKAQAQLVCSRNAAHTRQIEVIATQSTITPATCTTEGSAQFTVSYEGHPSSKTAVIPATGHSFGEDWAGDDTHHWHVCSACGEKSEYGEHIYDDEADTDCNTCGRERGIVEPTHSHSWAEVWTYNDTHHWHECEGEGTCDITDNSGKDGYAEHSYADEADTACDCGYERTITPAEPVNYTITEGALQQVAQGNEAIFVSDAEFEKFVKVLVDETELKEDDDYTAEEGSTKITLKGEYTRLLALGEHSFAIVSDDGKAETTFTVTENTQGGGDDDNPGGGDNDNPGDGDNDNPGDGDNDNPGDGDNDAPGVEREDIPGDNKPLPETPITEKPTAALPQTGSSDVSGLAAAISLGVSAMALMLAARRKKA